MSQDDQQKQHSLGEEFHAFGGNRDASRTDVAELVFPNVVTLPRDGRLQYLSRVVTIDGTPIQTIGFFPNLNLARTKAFDWIDRCAPGGRLTSPRRN